MSCLSHLGQKELITIARYKSNRDYMRELGRTAHDIENLQPAFDGNVLILERSWYGEHPVQDTDLDAFRENASVITGRQIMNTTENDGDPA